MPDTDRWFPAHLKELSRDECWELLGTRPVGRVGCADSDGPIIFPVNFVVETERAVLFRTAPHSVLAQHLLSSTSTPISFQVDDFDEYNQTGWSVLLRGKPSVVEQGGLPADDERPEPWAEGTRTLYVRLTPTDITGRRLVPA